LAAAGNTTVFGLAGSSAPFTGPGIAVAFGGAAGSTTVFGGAGRTALPADPGTSPAFEGPATSGVLAGNTTVFGGAGRAPGVPCGRSTSAFARFAVTGRLSSLAGKRGNVPEFATSSGDGLGADSSYALMADRSGVCGPLAKSRRAARRDGASCLGASDGTNGPASRPRASPNAATLHLEPPRTSRSPWPPRMAASLA